jgi:ankyrin repeat protein
MKKVILCFLGVLALNVNASDVLDMDKAVRGGDLSTVSTLLKKGVSPSVVINEGRNSIWKHSPLILAVKSENTELVKLLIKSGADVNYVNVGSTTALKEAASNDNDVIVSLLINSKADVNFVDENEVPLLFWAVSKESKKVIPLLIKAGADPDKEFNSMFYGKHSVKGYFSQEGKSKPSILSLL